ncbi:MAG: hypothetical protein II851_00190 [Bacteroidales bacterium]|nr:hypothetical protein [Bacteroidales bacterium]
MKKFFRVALVCALAGATLLYTGCTKDYSEDLNSLQKKVEEQGATIKSQGDQIADLLRAKQALEQADADALKLIQGLQEKADKLSERIDSLKKEKDALEGKVDTNLERIDSLINALTAKADSLRADVDSLKGVVAEHKQALDSLATELAKKADKTYVDTELGKKADKEWVENALANKADAQALIDTAASLRKGLMELTSEINKIKGDVADIFDELDKKVDKTTFNDVIDGIQSDMNQAKADIKKAQATADTAVAHAARALDYAKGVESYLKENYYTARTIDGFLAAKTDTAVFYAKMREIDKAIDEVIEAYQEADSILDQKIKTLDQKVDEFKDEYEAAIDSIWKKFAENDVDLQKLINRVQSIVYLPEFDDSRITLNWAQMFAQNIFDTREIGDLPPSFDKEAWEEFIDELMEDVPGNVKEELVKLIGHFCPCVPTPEEYDGYPEDAATPIPERSHVKYRVYGNDAATIVEGLVQAVKDSLNLLSFDVIRVRSRVNLDGVELNIVDAEVDGMFPDGSVIDLTIMPEGLPADFWLYTWDVKNFMNPSLHPYFFMMLLEMGGDVSQELYTWLYQQYMECIGIECPDSPNSPLREEAAEPAAEVEGDTEFPAFSASLVLTDPEQSRMITSAYWNVVPAANSEKINLWIKKDDQDITMKVFGDTVEIPYIDVDVPYEIFEGAELMFKVGDKDYTVEQFEALGMNLGDPQARFFASKDYSESIAVKVKGEELPEDYITNEADDAAGQAWAHLTELTPDGVGAKEYVALTYFVGPATATAFALVKVVPVKIEVEVDLWENADLQPFTWNYWKDAEIDAALLAGNTEKLYNRDSALAVLADEDKWEEDCEKAGITLADFAQKVPVDTATFFYVKYADGFVDTLMLKDLLAKEEGPKFNVAPFILADGTVMADVTDFPFYDYDGEDPDHGSVTEIAYVAYYNLPSDETPAVEVKVFGKIVVADRNREVIIVDLPETFEPFVVDYKKVILDTLRDAAAELVPEFPAGTYEAHSLPDSALIDAYQKDLYGRTDSLTMTVDEDVITKFAKARIITTVDEQHEAGHVLDYNTDSDFNVSWAANKVIEPYQTFKSIDTLWYGQVVIVNKTVRLDVDGIFEFERIPEYVAKEDDLNYYTTLQPWWKPDAATAKPYNVPANGYDAHQVLLNQHFRVVDVLKSIEEGQKVICTEIATTDEVEAGDLTEDYKDILDRVFKLEEDYENPNYGQLDVHPTIQVDSIPDPRNVKEVVVEAATGVKIDTANVVSYYSESEQEDAVGNLYAVNKNGSKVAMITNFNRGDATPSPRLAEAGVVVEHYENYVIKLFDPLRDITGQDKARINVNNSIITETSIYQFMQLKDKRDKNLIDYKQTDEGHYGWVKGNGTAANGFESGVYADDVYSLTFTHEMEYLTEISDETKARISFDEETGMLTYDNTLQTQLAKEIDIKLTIKIEYPWGTKTKEVVVTFYNTPVGE